MEDSKKTTILIVVIIACLAVAGIMFYVTRGGSDAESGQRGVMQLMRCRQCKTAFEMDQVEYYAVLQTPSSDTPPAPCQKCGKKAAYAAIKCPKCSVVFEKASAGIDKPVDKCTSCGFSETESRRAGRTAGK